VFVAGCCDNEGDCCGGPGGGDGGGVGDGDHSCGDSGQEVEAQTERIGSAGIPETKP